MTRVIFNSYLLLFLLGIVAAAAAAAEKSNFEVEIDNQDYKPSNLLKTISHHKSNNSKPTGAVHRAEVQFKTNLPSFNPDQSGVDRIVCKIDADGKGKVTFSLKDKKAVKDVKNWPKKVLLFISHKWECLGKQSNQFFIASDAAIDKSNLSATLNIIRSEFPFSSDEFSINVSFSENNNTHSDLRKFHFPHPHIPHPHIPHIPIPHIPHPHIPHIPIPHSPDLNIDKSDKISLNMLFDSATGKTSKPNIQLINDNGVKLLCSNCFIKGEATFELNIKGKLFPPKLEDASISLNGNFLMNLDFSLEGQEGKKLKPKSATNSLSIFSIGLSEFNIPDILNLGPTLNLVAAASATIGAGTLGFGGDLSISNFNTVATFDGSPTFQQSGFKPKVNAHQPTVGIDATASVSASLKPQLAFGIELLKGKLLKEQIGFELDGTFENTFTIGSSSTCDPLLKSTLDFDVGFFVDNRDFPIIHFPGIPLSSKCL